MSPCAVDHHAGGRRRGELGVVGDLSVHPDQAGREVGVSAVDGYREDDAT